MGSIQWAILRESLAYLALQMRIQNKEAGLAAILGTQASVRETSNTLRAAPEMLELQLEQKGWTNSINWML